MLVWLKTADGRFLVCLSKTRRSAAPPPSALAFVETDGTMDLAAFASWSLVSRRMSDEIVMALLQFTLVAIIVTLGSRLLWLLGVLAAGR